MKNLFLILFAMSLFFLVACGGGDVVTITDPEIQRKADIVIIEDYLLENGYTLDQIDTTESGVRYVILDEGQTDVDSLEIDESDFVDFNYIGRLTTGKLFDTSIESLAIQDTVVFNENRDYDPFTINYTSTGWAIEGRFINGFSDGITATFGKIHIGGHVLVAFPSDLGYRTIPQFGAGGVETIPANSVLTFEFFPIGLVKQ